MSRLKNGIIGDLKDTIAVKALRGKKTEPNESRWPASAPAARIGTRVFHAANYCLAGNAIAPNAGRLGSVSSSAATNTYDGYAELGRARTPRPAAGSR